MPPMLPNPELLLRLAKSAFGSEVKVKNEPRWRDYVEKSAREYSARQQEQFPDIGTAAIGANDQPLIDKWGLEDPALRETLTDADVQFDPKYADYSDGQRMAEIRRLVARGVPETVAVTLVIPPYQEEGGRPTIQAVPYSELESRQPSVEGRRQVQDAAARQAARANDPVLRERTRQEMLKLGRWVGTGALLAATAPGSVAGGTVGALGFAALKYGGTRLLPKAISAIARHSPDIAAGILRGEIWRRAAKGADLPWQAQMAADVVGGGGLPGAGLVKKGARSLLGMGDDAARAVPRGVEEAFDAARAGRGAGDVVLDGSTIPDVVGAPARVGKEVAEEIPTGATVLGETAGVLPRLTEDVPGVGRSLQEVSEESIEGQARKQIPLTTDQSLKTFEGRVGTDIVDVESPFSLREIVPIDKMSTSILRVFRNTRVGRLFGATDNPLATGVQAERERIREVGESLSNDSASRLGEIYRKNFVANDKGQILSLQGIDERLLEAPTIQDVAARLPRFIRYLSEGQLQAITQIKNELARYTDVARGLDVGFNTRPDIMDGGFYIPRGNAMEVPLGAEKIGFDHAIKHKVLRRVKGKAGFQQEAEFGSMAEGIKEGFEYDQFGTVVKGFVQRMSEVVSDAHIAQQLKNMTDSATGLSIGQDIADLVQPAVRTTVTKLRSQMSSRLGTLKKQGARLKEQEWVAKQSLKSLKDWRELTDKQADRLLAFQLGGSTDDVIIKAERELKVLDMGERKALAFLRKTEGRSLKWENAKAASRETIDSFQNQLDNLKGEYQKAVRLSRKPGKGFEFIDPKSTLGQRLRGTSFPMELADAINAQFGKEGVLVGRGGGPFTRWKEVNQFLVGMGATLDNSGLGIQGLLGMARNPFRYGKALQANIRAWGIGKEQGERTLGKYLLTFNEKVRKLGRMTSTEWAELGLRIGGGEHEFRFGAGFAAKIGDLPGIRQANRAFGVFGDTLRIEWADDMLKSELRGGRTLDEIRASGDLDLIANVVNNATGYSSKGALGSVGDWVLFAPRFLQSRINTIVNGVKGLRPGADIQQREARGALLRLISYGTTITVATNMARGKKTDFRMFVNGRYNSNFMRIRDVGGRDFSVFGPYESMLRVIATALAGSGEGSIAYQRIEALRGLTSPTVSTAWDLLTGEAIGGRRTRDSGFDEATTFVEDLIPFSIRDTPEILMDIAQGVREKDAEVIGGGIAAVASEMLGGKQSPLSFTDRANAFAAQLYGGAGPEPNLGDFASWWDNPETTYKNLDEKRKKRVRELVLKFYPEFKRKGKFWIQVGGEKEEEKEEKYKVDWS